VPAITFADSGYFNCDPGERTSAHVMTVIVIAVVIALLVLTVWIAAKQHKLWQKVLVTVAGLIITAIAWVILGLWLVPWGC